MEATLIVTNDHADYSENIVQSLEIECVKAGTSLNKVCKAVGVHQSVLSRWKSDEPKSIKTLRLLQAEIRKQSKAKAKA